MPVPYHTAEHNSYPPDQPSGFAQYGRTLLPESHLGFSGLQSHGSRSCPPSLNTGVPMSQTGQHATHGLQMVHNEGTRSRFRSTLTSRESPMGSARGNLPDNKRNIPDKRNVSVGTVANERYALGAAPTKEHENEDDFFVHTNPFSMRLCVCLCVCDGHDGRNAVKYTTRYLKARVFNTRSWRKMSQRDEPKVIEQALAELIKVTDAEFFKSINHFIAEKRRIQSQIPPVSELLHVLC